MAKRGGGKKKNKGGGGGGGAIKKSTASTNPDRKLPENKKQGFYRSKSTIKLLKMYSSKPTWMKEKESQPTAPARIQPDRRWFGNTRVIDQTKLSAFREALGQAHSDPYSVVLRRSKLPVSLLSPSTPGHTEDLEGREGGLGTASFAGGGGGQKLRGSALLSLQSFSDAFGDKRTRKRPALHASDLRDLLQQAELRQSLFDESRRREEGEEGDKQAEDAACEGLVNSHAAEVFPSPSSFSKGTKSLASEEIFKKGTSRRIWGELYKVIDASDVIVQVVDARDPLGTRCWRLEKYLKTARQSKHMILVLNKVDLIPPPIARVWLRRLSKDLPTLPFQAKKQEKAVGKLQLFQLLRQYAQLLSDRKHVSIGFIGYPNVGKSSVINALRSKQVCQAAPIPGQTRVWQYVALTKRLHLIDCPGVVPASEEISDSLKVIRGVVRPERIACPEDHIDEVLKRVQPENLRARYSLPPSCTWADAEEFLTILAKRQGKLKKGGEPDLSTAARIVLYDLQRGRIAYFVPPPAPSSPDEEEEEEGQGEELEEGGEESEEGGEENQETGQKRKLKITAPSSSSSSSEDLKKQKKKKKKKKKRKFEHSPTPQHGEQEEEEEERGGGGGGGDSLRGATEVRKQAEEREKRSQDSLQTESDGTEPLSLSKKEKTKTKKKKNPSSGQSLPQTPEASSTIADEFAA